MVNLKFKIQKSKFQFKIKNFKFCIVILNFTFLIFNFSYAEDFTYNSKGKRDPFIPLVGAGAVYQVKEAVDINSIEDVVLEGIVYDERGGSIAIINGLLLKEGDQAGVVVVDKIGPKKVSLVIEDTRHEVSLETEEKGR